MTLKMNGNVKGSD